MLGSGLSGGKKQLCPDKQKETKWLGGFEGYALLGYPLHGNRVRTWKQILELYFSFVLNPWPCVLPEFPWGCFLKHLEANRWKKSPSLPLSVLSVASWSGLLLLGLLISQTPEQSLAWLARGGYCLSRLHPDRTL